MAKARVSSMILNAVVNLQFDVPDNTKPYILHAMYIYNASLKNAAAA